MFDLDSLSLLEEALRDLQRKVGAK